MKRILLLVSLVFLCGCPLPPPPLELARELCVGSRWLANDAEFDSLVILFEAERDDRFSAAEAVGVSIDVCGLGARPADCQICLLHIVDAVWGQ